MIKLIFENKKSLEAELTTNHAMSRYGNPVLVDSEGNVYSAGDILLNRIIIEYDDQSLKTPLENFTNLLKFMG